MSQSFSQLKLDTILSKMGGSQKTASWNERFPTWEAEYHQGSRKEPTHGAGCFAQC